MSAPHMAENLWLVEAGELQTAENILLGGNKAY